LAGTDNYLEQNPALVYPQLIDQLPCAPLKHDNVCTLHRLHARCGWKEVLPEEEGADGPTRGHLMTLVVAMLAGWWLEHRRQATAVEEAALLEWKNRVLEEALLGQGTKVQADGATVTLTGKEGVSVVTPSSFTYNGKDGTRGVMKGIRPKTGKAPEYYYPPARTSSR
jgi:hypothetical protein